MYSMDKFENEEKFGFYYESDQDSGSDTDWLPSSQESVSSDSSWESSQESVSSQDSEKSI